MTTSTLEKIVTICLIIVTSQIIIFFSIILFGPLITYEPLINIVMSIVNNDYLFITIRLIYVFIFIICILCCLLSPFLL